MGRFQGVNRHRGVKIFFAFTVIFLYAMYGSVSNAFRSNNTSHALSLVSKETKTSQRKWDSAKSVVIALASGYGLNTYRHFVGSLRATNYKGHIILGIAPNADEAILAYLTAQNVTVKVVEIGKCTFHNHSQHNGQPSTEQKCGALYPDYKIQWGRFALARDWLAECEDCTDGVMLTDTRDAYFQTDPFSYVEDPPALMLFEEHRDVTTSHWLTNEPVKICKNTTFLATDPKPMLCSGSVMGSREGVLEYTKIMMEEFDHWKTRKECRSDMVGDDQSIHNYLYYTNRLPDAVAVPHRTGAIHVCGFEANKIFRNKIDELFDGGAGKFDDKFQAEGWLNGHRYYGTDEGDEWRNWLGPEQEKLTNAQTGFILNLDGRPSPQVHQFDRFGSAFNSYLDRMSAEVWN